MTIELIIYVIVQVYAKSVPILSHAYCIFA